MRDSAMNHLLTLLIKNVVSENPLVTELNDTSQSLTGMIVLFSYKYKENVLAFP